jgi:hypothetical protein
MIAETQRPVQQGLAFALTIQQEFERWVHTAEGGAVANLFIRLAIGCKRRGTKVGARLIGERIRWHYQVKKTPGSKFKVNDHVWPYLGRFAEERAPELAGMFTKRELGKQRVIEEVSVVRRKRAA